MLRHARVALELDRVCGGWAVRSHRGAPARRSAGSSRRPLPINATGWACVTD